jgi:hypothetical protein
MRIYRNRRVSKPRALRVAQERGHFEHVVRHVEPFAPGRLRLLGTELLGLGDLRGAAPARTVRAESSRDHRDSHLVGERFVDDRAEDDIRVLIRRRT